MAIDVRKTLTDTGYVAVGVAVLGFQQVQVRRHELRQRLSDGGGCVGARAADGRARVEALQQRVGDRATTVRDEVETRARAANEWAQELGVQVKERIEPVIEQVVEQVKAAATRAA